MELKRKEALRDRLNSLTVLFVLLLMLVVFSVIAPGFFSTRNLYYLLQQASVVGLLAVGETFVIVSKGIDLSVGTTVGLSCIMSALFITEFHMPLAIAICLAILLGALVGVINGILVAVLGIPAFIATLGTMYVFEAVALLSCGGNNIYSLPEAIKNFSNLNVFEILPSITVITIVLAVVAHILLSKTRFGRYTYAIGSNEEAARFSGVRVKTKLFIIYLMSGFLSGIAGILMLCRLNCGVALAGDGYEMNAIAAVVIGGGSLFGGEGSIPGALVGALIMTVLSNGLQLMGVSTYWQKLLIGIVLVCAVFIDNMRRKKEA